VRWGIRDFESRFGRKPEGMWLPETAVDIDSLEALAAEGIAYTILEPHQAARYRRLPTAGAAHDLEAVWQDAHGHIDPTVAYRCPLPSGRSIDIFFYDGPISRAVAFERLLARGENLAHRLAGAFSDTREHAQLVNIATDGETYGHHHRFGEMALAYALELIEEQGLARLTNYAEHLEREPPQYEVEIVERTAWSCSHGVERWNSDCGCNTGSEPGWNQRWRTPLRAALDWLRDQAAEIYAREGALLLGDPWAARDDYVDVILDRSESSRNRFLSRHARSGVKATEVLELLEMQRYAMLMYTSCGWFFSDLSGIETVQVLHYAGRVIQLAEKAGNVDLEPTFLRHLEPARSNRPDRGTGRQIYEEEVVPACLDLSRVAAHYAVLSLFDTFDDDTRIYCYEVVRRDLQIHKAGRARLSIGSIEVCSVITQETASFELAALHLGETELTGGVRLARERYEHSNYEHVRAELAEAMEPGGIPTVIRLLDAHFGETPISIRSLFRDEQRRVMRQLTVATLEEAESAFRQLHERDDPLMRFHNRLGIPVPKVLQTAAEFDLNLQIRRLLEAGVPSPAEIDARLREAKEEVVTLDETTLLAFRNAVDRAAERFQERPDDFDRLDAFENIVTIVGRSKLPIDLHRAQNRYYRMRRTVRPAIEASGPAAHTWLELFDSLGGKLAVAPE